MLLEHEDEDTKGIPKEEQSVVVSFSTILQVTMTEFNRSESVV